MEAGLRVVHAGALAAQVVRVHRVSFGTDWTPGDPRERAAGSGVAACGWGEGPEGSPVEKGEVRHWEGGWHVAQSKNGGKEEIGNDLLPPKVRSAPCRLGP